MRRRVRRERLSHFRTLDVANTGEGPKSSNGICDAHNYAILVWNNDVNLHLDRLCGVILCFRNLIKEVFVMSQWDLSCSTGRHVLGAKAFLRRERHVRWKRDVLASPTDELLRLEHDSVCIRRVMYKANVRTELGIRLSSVVVSRCSLAQGTVEKCKL
jgi:hypothetical protein